MVQTRAMVRDDEDKKRKQEDEEKTAIYFQALFYKIMVNNCPKCGAIIWKDGGCCKVVCFQCNCRFCFTCTSTKECKCIGTSGHGYFDYCTGKVHYVYCWI